MHENHEGSETLVSHINAEQILRINSWGLRLLLPRSTESQLTGIGCEAMGLPARGVAALWQLGPLQASHLTSWRNMPI